MDAVMTKKYTLQELSIGMKVRESQISHIFDTYFIMIESKLLNDDDVEGTLVYIGDGEDEQYDAWFKQNKPITPLYFSSEDAEDGVVYDE